MIIILKIMLHNFFANLYKRVNYFCVNIITAFSIVLLVVAKSGATPKLLL